MNILLPKRQPIRDAKWLEEVRLNGVCIFTGERSNDSETVDPAHIGTRGKALKSGDDEVLPVIHRIHALMHHRGEMTVMREQLPDYMLRAFARAYARELYRQWKSQQTK